MYTEPSFTWISLKFAVLLIQPSHNTHRFECEHDVKAWQSVAEAPPSCSFLPIFLYFYVCAFNSNVPYLCVQYKYTYLCNNECGMRWYKISSPTEGNNSSMDAQWGWVCHLCNARYRFSATRRCLYDGHVFCLNAVASGQACRDIFAARGITLGKALNTSDCWRRCEYPLQCKEKHTGLLWKVQAITRDGPVDFFSIPK